MNRSHHEISIARPLVLGVPRETMPGERRVALCPDDARALADLGLTVRLERGAGAAAGFDDAAYRAAGAAVMSDRTDLFGGADIIAQVNTYPANPAAGARELEALHAGQAVIGLADPLGATPRVAELSARCVVGFGLELVPRITRAQSMDVLSSMAMVAGYRAAVLAAARLPRCFPMSMTAAGTVHAARVLVIGAGVAGLQAIATARRLGAVVRAYDVRPAAREQVESVGGVFVSLHLETGDSEDAGGYARAQGEEFLAQQRVLLAEVVADSDVVITTAAVPGQPAPVLVTREMVASMSQGSVVVDLAAPRGGNCECTRPGHDLEVDGVSVLGPLNLPADIPYHASRMYSRNLASFVRHLVRERALHIDDGDEITRGTLMCRDGEVVHARLRQTLGMEPLPC
ncbi:MAG TPA: NAD(P) transhydrogenase subunit alpha [Kofleriaceae bacterium]|nr:NAD(P) transhydrogenase subunit alpha [Kofleriaceae bacterium]